jgi:hypothetical protein
MSGSPVVILTDLHTPEVILISASDGTVYMVADHNAPAEKLAAVRLMAENLPPMVPVPRGSDGLG